MFDNIPLTALALKQGGYDWGYLAYAVGFGGSMVWFGSSAGVALSNMYPEAKSVGLWLRHGWPVAVAYVIGFFVMLAILGWKPDAGSSQARRASQRDGGGRDGGCRGAALGGASPSTIAVQGIPVALPCSFPPRLCRRRGMPRQPLPG